MSQQFDTNVLPDSTGRDLGSTTQRWDVYGQTADFSGALSLGTLNGIYLADKLATGGSGTVGSPWTGWDSALAALSGSVWVIFPPGYYSHSSVINLSTSGSQKTNWRLTGSGKDATIITSAHTGSGFFAGYTVNGSTAARIRIENLTIKNSNGSNIGCGIDQVAGTFVTISDVKVQGFKYGIVFDQTELGDILDCDFESCLTAGVWLANGAEHTIGASQDFTNRISIQRCQFNLCAYGIIDDGGAVHSVRDNSFNGGTYGMWVAHASPVTIEVNEFEGMSTQAIRMSSNSAQGSVAVGAGIASIKDNLFAPGSTIRPIRADSVLHLKLIGNQFASNGNCITGTNNINTLFSAGNYNDFNTAFFDSTATRHISLDDYPNGGSVADVIKNALSLSSTLGVTGATTLSSTLAVTGNLTSSADTKVKRLKASQGTALVAGDFALSAGWGSTAAVSAITGTDQGAQFTVTPGGAGIGANPTITVTFKDGTWTNAPIAVVQRIGGNDAAPSTVGASVSATALTISPVYTPVSGNTTIFSFICMGR
jgi:hypothetical protein